MPLGRYRPRVCRPSRQQRARAHREHQACVRPRPSHAIGNRVPCGVIVRPKRVPSSTRGGGRTLRDRRFTRSGAADRMAVSRLSAAECENERCKSAHAHRFVHSRDDAVAFFDSFSYRPALKDAAMPTDGLAFVPLSTPESMSTGISLPCHIRQKPRVRHAV